MPAELEIRASEAVEMAQRAGADEAWASATRSRDVEFEYRDGRLENVKDTTSQGLGIRVYARGRYSSHSTTDLHPDRLRDFVEEAVAVTRALEPDEHRRITPPELFAQLPGTDLELVDTNVAALDRERRMEWCSVLHERASAHERVVSATAGVYDGTVEAASASSNGFVGSQSSSYCWTGAEVTLVDRDDRRASDSYYPVAVHLADLPDLSDTGTRALARALARLGAQKGPTLKGAMVVDAQAAGSLIGRLLGPASALSIQQGRSYWSALIGKQAFSERLTIVDDPLIPRGLGSRYYDEEGIGARHFPVVEGGYVRNAYVDTYYGAKAGLEPTTGTPSNRVVVPGTNSLQEMLAAVGRGIYVTSWLGGNADSTTGDFSLGLRGHVIENGAIGRPVGEMNVTGNLRDLFSRLELIGNDPYLYAATLAPSLVFADVDFAGA